MKIFKHWDASTIVEEQNCKRIVVTDGLLVDFVMMMLVIIK
jgi:hypothetical protein